MSETEQEETQRPLTIAMVVDTSGNRGNGTSNSALQWAEELKRQGHTVRLVGIGAPEYPARVNHVPLVSWVAKSSRCSSPNRATRCSEPRSEAWTWCTSTRRSVWPACVQSRQTDGNRGYCGLSCAAGEHHVFGRSAEIYSGHRQVHLLAVQFVAVPQIDHVHVPTELGASLLRSHGYKSKLHVISNGYESRFTAKTQRDAGKSAPVPFHIVASGRLTNEKNHVALIHAIARCRHAQDIELTIAGTGPLKRNCSDSPHVCFPDRHRSDFIRTPKCPRCCVPAICWCILRLPISNR